MSKLEFYTKYDDVYDERPTYVAALRSAVDYLIVFPEGIVEVYINTSLEHDTWALSKAAFELDENYTDEELLEAVHQAEKELSVG